MNTIKGKIRKIIYQNNNGYLVALFRVKQADKEELKELLNKTITVTGILLGPNEEQTYILTGEYINNAKFGWQYSFKSYEIEKMTDESAVIEYLSSSLIKGCGEKTAIKIVDALGVDAINIIKENPEELLKISGITLAKKDKIYNSIMANLSIDELVLKLKSLGFSISECSKIIHRYEENTMYFIDNNIYMLTEIIDFNKIDRIFCLNKDENDPLRHKACVLQTMQTLSNRNGDTYYFKDEIENALKSLYNLNLSQDILDELVDDEKIVIIDDKYFLSIYYEMEEDIASNLFNIKNRLLNKMGDIDSEIAEIEYENNLKYNDEQKNAIKTALNNRITIISGGPGTGKTTIINAIVRIYISMHKLSPIDIYENIALLAPTGRASKKMASSTNLPAMTIHRYLKWNKDTNDFAINEHNRNYHKLIIVDEVSMIDVNLFNALLKGLTSNIQLVLVGDVSQLPSVGPGLILGDLITSKAFSFCPLQKIYRQSETSYIPYLAKEIKEEKIGDDLLSKKGDYNFLETNENNIKAMISKICQMSMEKNLKADDIQILAPVYKGANGIDNLNKTLREVFNPLENQNEIKVGDVIYRENDKVLQLVNNPDINVYNGDIGYITKIEKTPGFQKKENIVINFEGTYVTYTKEDMKDIIHAYAITIHKSQGSEFPHVIMPVERHYQKMLYNKLIYTGVSRAKKSLVIIGESESLRYAIQNNYSNNRKTDLQTKLLYIFRN
ncbi:MAG: ATP-dependent RecD-like DNA helicase [Bacilli bacterium]|nr:ATP-dependent RecD-like DNA helicase [Bacilli bacterium]